MTNVRAVEAKRAEAVSCPRCLSMRVVESRRNALENLVCWTVGFLPCRCTACMHRFAAFNAPGWVRELTQKALRHQA